MIQHSLKAKKRTSIFIFLLFVSSFSINAYSQEILPGAYKTDEYILNIQAKKVGFVGNHTSLINKTHWVDSVLKIGVNIVKIFTPEHGFRGMADAGALIKDSVDLKTGIPLISLYGTNKKPSTLQLNGIEVMVFDMQDIGVRCFTYISTLHYVMEACAENKIPLIVLDRPNPNGFYIDGPVLYPKYVSFVGLHPVPLVYGMTIGEYAQMINGEAWLANGVKADLKVISCSNYTHESRYVLPAKPSPNLPTMHSVYLYPSLVLFEGTNVSVGRGTQYPFEVFGHPDFKADFTFTPTSQAGAMNPLYKNKKCYGFDLRNDSIPINNFDINYVIKAYSLTKDITTFFNSFFYKLSGNNMFMEQIRRHFTSERIKATWQKDLDDFKLIRAKYLIYP